MKVLPEVSGACHPCLLWSRHPLGGEPTPECSRARPFRISDHKCQACLPSSHHGFTGSQERAPRPGLRKPGGRRVFTDPWKWGSLSQGRADLSASQLEPESPRPAEVNTSPFMVRAWDFF